MGGGGKSGKQRGLAPFGVFTQKYRQCLIKAVWVVLLSSVISRIHTKSMKTSSRGGGREKTSS